MAIIPCQRELFDLPADVTYLNCAYMSPLMKQVMVAGEAAIRRKGHPWQVSPPDFFSESGRVRDLAGQLVGAPAHNMAIVPAVSYAAATAAKNLTFQADQNILCLEEQFGSNVYSWKEEAKKTGATFTLLARPQDGDWTRTLLETINNKTALVAVPNCHWTDGAMIDLEAISQRCRDVGAALFLDLAQSAGAMPIDLSKIQPDFAVYPTYKWAMGPYSLGFMYVHDRWLDGSPLEESWITRKGSEDFAGLVDYKDDYAPGAIRFDMGQRAQFQLMPMAEAALTQLLHWGVDNIAETLGAMNDQIIERASHLGLTAAPTDLRAPHYLGLRFPNGVPGDLLETLAKQKIYISIRGDSMRVTPHLYNTEQDVDRLFQALESVQI